MTRRDNTLDNKPENKLYQFDEELKEELTWDKICEQLGHKRYSEHPFGRFRLIKEGLSSEYKGIKR